MPIHPLRAFGTLCFWSRLIGARCDRDSLMSWLAEVELARFADQQVGGFSAGMRKRLTLLRTRIESPQLVLWDEPFAALDSAGRRMLAGWARDFRRGGGTMILATHDIELGAELCPRALVLEEGQLRWTGPSSGAQSAMEALR